MRVIFEGRRKLSGTPLEIVKELGKFVRNNNGRVADEYMALTLQRLGSRKKLRDKTLKKRCESFLKELQKHVDLKIL